jgi:hypothetical protein
MGIDFLKNIFAELTKRKEEQKPAPPVVPEPDPDQPGQGDAPKYPPAYKPVELVIMDMKTIGDDLRAYLGVTSRDGYIWYGACCRALAGSTDGPSYPDWEGDGTSDGEQLIGKGDKIREWLEARITKAVETMRTNPKATVTIIKNDGPDCCGNRLQWIKTRFSEFDQCRVSLGEIVSHD